MLRTYRPTTVYLDKNSNIKNALVLTLFSLSEIVLFRSLRHRSHEKTDKE
ncbi:MAG: hypothetical protein JNM36_19085 [Chitinophagales bacterium]|nr:hypothetical protein [Chitinophagales bacterium]